VLGHAYWPCAVSDVARPFCKDIMAWLGTEQSSELLRRVVRPPSSGLKLSWTCNQHVSLPPVSTGFLLGLFFGPENGGDIVIRKVGPSPKNTVFQTRRFYFQHMLGPKVVESTGYLFRCPRHDAATGPGRQQRQTKGTPGTVRLMLQTLFSEEESFC
jgi:hypothetical protein